MTDGVATTRQHVVARHGESVELWGDTSLRECTLAVSGLVSMDPDNAEHVATMTLELELDRADVVELRDMLNTWLQRGAL
jgi:hypothetical protein